MVAKRFAKRMSGMSGNVIREILKLTQRPEVISFAGGLPSAETFPSTELAAAASRLLKAQGSKLLQYGISEGDLTLRQLIAARAERLRLEVSPDEVVVTSGSQQGIDLVAKALIDPGDRVGVESPTYLAALQIMRCYQARFVPIEADGEGMRPEALEKAAQEEEIKLIYLVPNFANPTGKTLSEERRRAIVEVAARYGFWIIEDDPYGELRYRGTAKPALKAYDREGRVIYLGSFSKVVAPGLRLGYAVVTDAELRRLLVVGKQSTDVHSSNLSQALIADLLRSGFLDRHLKTVRRLYGEKLDAMLTAMERYFPPGLVWTRPEGGLFIWCTLPGGLDAGDLLQEAVKRNVAFIPGSPFYPCGEGANAMRLNFSNASHEDIERGMRILGEVIGAEV